VDPEQQPLGQVVALQLVQIPSAQGPPAQAWQASPPFPHAASAFPDRQDVPEQQPPGQEAPSQMQAPPAQCWPAAHGARVPQTQPPAVEQASAASASHVTHAAPAIPQLVVMRGLQNPLAQQPSGHKLGSHEPVSSRHDDEQPSPEKALPSSHSSMPDRTLVSPQMAGSPRVSAALTSSPIFTTMACCSLARMVAPARPSTRRITVLPASAAGSRMTAFS
jgi:hypothetical protein